MFTSRIDAIVIKSDFRKTLTEDGYFIEETIQPFAYLTRAEADSKITLRVDAFEEGQASNIPSEFTVYSKFNPDIAGFPL